MKYFFTIFSIILLSASIRAQVGDYLYELNFTSILMNQCKINGEVSEQCIELKSKDIANQPHNHLLFSRLAAKYYFANNINKAYKYALLSENSINFNNNDFDIVFEIYKDLGHKNYIKTELLRKFSFVYESDKLEYGYYLSKIESDDIAYKYVEANYDYRKDKHVNFRLAQPYLDQLWMKSPSKAVLFCEHLLREQQKNFSEITNKNYIHYDFESEKLLRNTIHMVYVFKALAHSRLKEFRDATQCLQKADEYQQYTSSNYIDFICGTYVYMYSIELNTSMNYIKNGLPRSLVSELSFCQ